MPQLVPVVPKAGGYWITNALTAVHSTTTRRQISNVFDAIPHVKAAMVSLNFFRYLLTCLTNKCWILILKGVKKTNCLNCTTGYSYFNGKCESKCPAGTYHNAAEDLCVLCDSDRCATCITSATSCTSCMPPHSLDEAAFRCTSATTLAVENIPHNNSTHFLVLGVSLLTFLVAAAFIVFSIVKFLNLNLKAKTSTMSYNKVEYSPLHDTLDIS